MVASRDGHLSGRSPIERVRDTPLIERALARAVRKALIEHKRAGNPVAAWRDGEVVLIQPEDIVIPAEVPSEEEIETHGDVTR